MVHSIVTIWVKNFKSEDVINFCINNEIILVNVKMLEDGFCFDIGAKNSKVVLKYLKENKANVHIQKRSGIYFLLKKIYARKGLLVGFALAFCTIYLGLSYIWSYDISGNQNLSENDVKNIVQNYGLKVGVSKNNFDYEEITKQILIDYNEQLAWIWLNNDGCVLQIKIREKDNGDRGAFKTSNLVASRDATIENILVLQGMAKVKDGDVVKKGQVLIEGVEYNKWIKDEMGVFVPDDVGTKVKARGVVSGITTFSAKGVCALSEDVVKSAQKRQRYIIKIGDKEFFSGKDSENSVLRKECWNKNFTYKDLSFGISKIDEYKGEINHKEYTMLKAYDEALKRARASLKDELGDVKVIKEEINTKVVNGVFEVDLLWFVKENLTVEMYT